MVDTPLPEDADERRMFDDMAKTAGGNLQLVAITLRTWARVLPADGSMAKTCAIMANEISKGIL